MEGNVDFNETLAKLAEGLSSNDLYTKIKRIQEFHVDFQNELILRRNQVERLSNELDSVNLEKYQLTRALEKVKANLKENESTVGVVMEKCQSQAEKIRGLNETLIGIKLSQELKTVEVEGLNKFNQELVREKMSLTRQIEELQTKCKSNAKTQSEFDKFKKSLTSMVSEIKDQTGKLELEHNKLKLVKNQVSFEKITECSQFYVMENQKLKKKIFELEEDLAKTESKCIALENLFQKHQPIVEEDPINKFILNQWKKSFKAIKDQNDSKIDIINNLTNKLGNEKAACTQAFLKNHELELKIQELNEKLSQLQSCQKN